DGQIRQARGLTRGRLERPCRAGDFLGAAGVRYEEVRVRGDATRRPEAWLVSTRQAKLGRPGLTRAPDEAAWIGRVAARLPYQGLVGPRRTRGLAGCPRARDEKAGAGGNARGTRQVLPGRARGAASRGRRGGQ